jgi:hemerythrin-like domain-containing protein
MDGRFPGFLSVDVGFEVPLEMLAACHGRITHQCETLQRLVLHLATRGADDEARSAAAAITRYFDTAAKLHHDDEEVDLFPALLESMAGSDAVCLREMTERLTREHLDLEQAWRQVSRGLHGVALGDSLALDARDVAAFVQGYARHIDYEERELIPMADRLLTPEQLDSVGSAMRRRRIPEN